MAKKNKPTKKHRFKHVESGAGVSAGEVTEETSATISRPASVPRTATQLSSTVAGRDFSYVSYDLRRVGIFAVSLIALEFILWYVLGSTGFGSALYNMVHV